MHQFKTLRLLRVVKIGNVIRCELKLKSPDFILYGVDLVFYIRKSKHNVKVIYGSFLYLKTASVV